MSNVIGHFINGAEVADDNRPAPVYNPATGEQSGNVAMASKATVEEAIAAAEAEVHADQLAVDFVERAAFEVVASASGLTAGREWRFRVAHVRRYVLGAENIAARQQHHVFQELRDHQVGRRPGEHAHVQAALQEAAAVLVAGHVGHAALQHPLQQKLRLPRLERAQQLLQRLRALFFSVCGAAAAPAASQRGCILPIKP